MKSAFLLKIGMLFILFVMLHSTAFCQSNQVVLTHYLFPEFKKGLVLMKSGEKHETLLNYNSLTEEMVFEEKGSRLAMGNLDQVDTVYIEGRKFFLLNNKFVELIYQGKLTLLVENRCNVKEPGKPAPYGGTSQVSSTDSYSSFFSGGQKYELQLPTGFETIPYKDYWLKKDGKFHKFLSVRQMTKFLRDQSEIVKEYIKVHEVKYDNQSSIVELIRYLDEK